ncbi:MAG: ImmA/IrrE family metallo-endopeptidase [Gammaproteobacteria bacterium]|nr:ImmA/IrrE family metallo-endopeptidase [Gammaproteobacteria bacterium]
MTIDLEKLAEDFWSAVGGKESYPRSLETSVGWALPLAIVKLTHLGVRAVEDWFHRRGMTGFCELTDRQLRACLVARFGHGIVLIDATDPEDEQRFSLAHELAHFILDYLKPRQTALAALGSDVLDVLDGLRKPTPQERLSGVLRGLVIGSYTNLMDRTTHNSIADINTLDSETMADRLALELLAPLRATYAKMGTAAIDFRNGNATTDTTALLLTHFGLPARIARSYATMLVYRRRSKPSFREWLGI